MAKRTDLPNSGLVQAAAALEAELERFEDSLAAFRKLPLTSKKNLDRALDMLNDLADVETRLGPQLKMLIDAVGGTRERQMGNIGLVKERSKEIQERVIAYQKLVTQLQEIGAGANAINGRFKQGAPSSDEIAREL